MNDREERIYRILDFISNAYSTAENVFPFWEAAFALIIGQLLVAYFDPAYFNANGTIELIDLRVFKIHPQMLLSIIGCIISYIWFILVSLNYQNAAFMDDKLKRLKTWIDFEFEYSKDYKWQSEYLPDYPFVWPWPTSKERDEWGIWNILIGHNKSETPLEGLIKARRSTWLYRRILPAILLVIWTIFLALTYQNGLSWICFIMTWVALIIVTVMLFDP
jgi:hypothetical protein